VLTGTGALTVKTAVAGAYTGVDDFSFTVNAMNTGRSDVRGIIEALAYGATSITFTIHDMKNPAVVVRSEFPAGEAAPVIEKVLRGYCR
jgi:hypothetical protein